MAKRVLIIDDDRSIARYLSVALSEHGYDPIHACNGNEGLRRAKQSKPDLIVLDVMMPGKSGFILLNELKRDEQCKDIPVLMLTAIGEILDDVEGHKEEAAEEISDPLRGLLKKKIRELREDGLIKPEMFAEKPIDPESFIAKVQQLIGS